MCQYWKKLHTCKHLSDRPYVEMCRPGYLSNTVCQDISDDEVPRRSYFPCWACIKQGARTETLEKLARAQAEAAAADAAREQALKLKIENDKRAREERVRREAKEKAERERAAEQKMKAEREMERERAKKEGGAWTLAESNSGKKKKGKASVLACPTSPPFVTGLPKKDAWKENEKITWSEGSKSASVAGRAGTWGPKKILSRKEGAMGVLGDRSDSAVGINGRK